MTDNASSYPTAIDPQAVVLEADIDWIPADALQLLMNQVEAIQTELGVDLVDFSSVGGPDFGTLAALLIALCRLEVGQFTTADVKGGFRVTFEVDANGNPRFTAPPVVLVQKLSAAGASPGANSHHRARRVTTTGFTIASGHGSRANAAGLTYDWLAFQPPFGIEQTLEDEDD